MFCVSDYLRQWCIRFQPTETNSLVHRFAAFHTSDRNMSTSLETPLLYIHIFFSRCENSMQIFTYCASKDDKFTGAELLYGNINHKKLAAFHFPHYKKICIQVFKCRDPAVSNFIAAIQCSMNTRAKPPKLVIDDRDSFHDNSFEYMFTL